MVINILIFEYLFLLYDRLYVFFFQAEDGIRDYKVTGVQTCALPIFVDRTPARPFSDIRPDGCGRAAQLTCQAVQLFSRKFPGWWRRSRLAWRGPSARQIGRASCRERV